MAPVNSVIVCTSVHHGNTHVVAEAMASATGGWVLRPGDEAHEAIHNADVAGFGSGIFFGSHHRDLLQFAGSLNPVQGCGAFLFSTSGTGHRIPRLIGVDYHRKLRRILQRKGYTIVGEFDCRGFDTYGPWGRLGGIAKGHPNNTDLKRAFRFAHDLIHSE